jgi:hypothetical protein
VGVVSLAGFFSTIALLVKELMVFVSYVKNNAFPQPLSEKEEEKYSTKLHEGDPYARNKLLVGGAYCQEVSNKVVKKNKTRLIMMRVLVSLPF